MHISFHTIFHRKNFQFLMLGCACIVGSFLLGAETAGEVQPFTHSEAVGMEASLLPHAAKPGDMDGDGVLGVSDVIAILEIDQGYREATPEELKSDTDGDLRLTVKDALRVLHMMALR